VDVNVVVVVVVNVNVNVDVDVDVDGNVDATWTSDVAVDDSVDVPRPRLTISRGHACDSAPVRA
jgi:hypothetical protein